MALRDDARGISEGLAVLVSSVVGLVVATAAVWYVNGPFDSSFESLYRVDPSVEGGGVGADWTAGNTDPFFDFLIALTHAADVLMGVFILLMVFIHWGSFRRLAARMQEPGTTRSEDAVATDGGERAGARSATDSPEGGDRE